MYLCTHTIMNIRYIIYKWKLQYFVQLPINHRCCCLHLTSLSSHQTPRADARQRPLPRSCRSLPERARVRDIMTTYLYNLTVRLYLSLLLSSPDFTWRTVRNSCKLTRWWESLWATISSDCARSIWHNLKIKNRLHLISHLNHPNNDGLCRKSKLYMHPFYTVSYSRF